LALRLFRILCASGIRAEPSSPFSFSSPPSVGFFSPRNARVGFFRSKMFIVPSLRVICCAARRSGSSFVCRRGGEWSAAVCFGLRRMFRIVSVLSSPRSTTCCGWWDALKTRAASTLARCGGDTAVFGPSSPVQRLKLQIGSSSHLLNLTCTRQRKSSSTSFSGIFLYLALYCKRPPHRALSMSPSCPHI